MSLIRTPEGDVEMDACSTIEDAMRSAGMTPDSYIYLIGGRPVPMDVIPPEDSEIKAMRVASGG